MVFDEEYSINKVWFLEIDILWFWSDPRNLKNADLMGGKADAVIHVRLGDKEMKTKVRQCL